MKQILHIGMETYLLPSNAEYLINLSRALEGLQIIRYHKPGGYILEPAEYSCEILSEAMFQKGYPAPKEMTNDESPDDHSPLCDPEESGT